MLRYLEKKFNFCWHRWHITASCTHLIISRCKKCDKKQETKLISKAAVGTNIPVLGPGRPTGPLSQLIPPKEE